MGVQELLGRRVGLPILRFASSGAYLGAGDEDVLLPGGEIPAGAKVGDRVDVFVHLDAEERPIATTRPVKLALGEVAFLTVTSTTDIGAFVDWGPGKELLVPFAQQSKDLVVGERQPIGLYLDKSGRLAGTMFVGDLLGASPREFELDEWLDGEAWRNDPAIGLFAIVERTHVGLVPASEPHRLRRGETARFRVAEILPDGKLVLSLRRHAHEEMAADAHRILKYLAGEQATRIGDKSPPELIRELFGVSKKAFKRAVGRLLVDKKVEIDDEGLLRLRR